MWYHSNEHMVNTETSLINMRRWPWDLRDNSGYGLSHCETTLHCNVVFYWLNSYPDLFLDLLGPLHFGDRTYSLLFFINGPFSFQEFVAQEAVFLKVDADWSFMLIWTDIREDGFSFFLFNPFCFLHLSYYPRDDLVWTDADWNVMLIQTISDSPAQILIWEKPVTYFSYIWHCPFWALASLARRRSLLYGFEKRKWALLVEHIGPWGIWIKS